MTSASYDAMYDGTSHRTTGAAMTHMTQLFMITPCGYGVIIETSVIPSYETVPPRSKYDAMTQLSTYRRRTKTGNGPVTAHDGMTDVFMITPRAYAPEGAHTESSVIASYPSCTPGTSLQDRK